MTQENLIEQNTKTKEISPNKSLNNQILRLLNNGSSLSEIVSLLGAEQFMSTIHRRASEPVLHLDVDAFLESKASKDYSTLLPSEYIHYSETILPPSNSSSIEKNGNRNSEELSEITSKVSMLVEILSKLQLPYSVAEGLNRENMVRQLSYKIFILPSVEKLVFITDESKNATYIVYNSLAWQEYAKYTKEELRKLPNIKFIKYPTGKENCDEIWAHQIEKSIRENIYSKSRIRIKQELLGEIEESEIAPENWKTAKEIAIINGFDIETIQEIAKRKASKEELVKSPNKKGGVSIYYSPSLVDKIEIELAERIPAPEGWMTTRGLAGKLGVDVKLITKNSELFRKSNPEWFKNYKSTMGNMREHFSPELIGLVSNKIKEQKSAGKAPDGWATRRKIAGTLETSYRAIDKEVDKQQLAHPEWFRKYLDYAGREIDHFHPDFIKLLESKFKSELPPEGWLTKKKASAMPGLHDDLVKREIEEQRKLHPEWFHEYLTVKKQLTEHLHPDFIRLLELKYKK